MSKRPGSPLPPELQQVPFSYDLSSTSSLSNSATPHSLSHNTTFDLPIDTTDLGAFEAALGISPRDNPSNDMQVGSSKDLDYHAHGQSVIDGSLEQSLDGSAGGAESGDGVNGKRAKRHKSSGPRTSRACLACRKQKMRCEGADDPPCRRCVSQKLDCQFERRSDYMLNPEDQAWQKKITTQLDDLTSTVGRIVDALAQHGIIVAPASARNSGVAGPSHTGSADLGVDDSVDVNDFSSWTAAGDEPTGYDGRN